MNRSALCTVLLSFMALPPLLSGCRGGSRDDVVTLRFWAMGREGEVVQALVRDFEREHRGIRVRVQQIPFTAAHEKLLTAHVGESTPDISQLGNTWIAEFVAIGALEALDPWIARSATVQPSDFFEGIWDTNVIGDSAYGIPWYVDTRVIFYRKDILARAGYPQPPSSWAGWVEAMRAVKKVVGQDRYAIFLPIDEWAQPVILGMQAGSSLLRDEGRYGAFSDSAFRRAFEFYVSLYREDLAPPISTIQVANVFQEFANGMFAMYITGPWNLGEFRRRLPREMQDKWGTAPLPGPRGDSTALSLAGGSSLVIFRDSEHKAEAWKLLEFLSRPEQQLRFYALSGDLPARVEAWRDSSLIGDEYARAFWEQLQRVEPLPKVPEIEMIVTTVFDHAASVIRGGVPVQQALAELDREVDRILEKRRWLLERDDRKGLEEAS